MSDQLQQPHTLSNLSPGETLALTRGPCESLEIGVAQALGTCQTSSESLKLQGILSRMAHKNVADM